MISGLSTFGVTSPVRSNLRNGRVPNLYRKIDTTYNAVGTKLERDGSISFSSRSTFDGIADDACVRTTRTTTTGLPSASIRFGTNDFIYFYTYQNSRSFGITNVGVSVGIGQYYAWGNVGNPFGTPVTSLFSPTANVIEQRNNVTPTTGQDLRIFNTYTNRGSGVTNLEFLSIKAISNVFRIQSFKGSAGGSTRSIEFAVGGTDTNGTMTEGTLALTIAADAGLTHNSTKLGFYNATAISKPTISGSKSSGAALSSLLTKLSNLGLITDSTSA